MQRCAPVENIIEQRICIDFANFHLAKKYQGVTLPILFSLHLHSHSKCESTVWLSESVPVQSACSRKFHKVDADEADAMTRDESGSMFPFRPLEQRNDGGAVEAADERVFARLSQRFHLDKLAHAV